MANLILNSKGKVLLEVNGDDQGIVISETHGFKSDIAAQVLENGLEYKDHVVEKPDELSITLYVSNSNSEVLLIVFKSLRNICKSREVLTVITSLDVYENVILTDVSVPVSAPFKNASSISLTFEPLNISKEKAFSTNKSKRKGVKGGSNGNPEREKPESDEIPSIPGIPATPADSASGAPDVGSSDENFSVSPSELKNALLYYNSSSKSIDLTKVPFSLKKIANAENIFLNAVFKTEQSESETVDSNLASEVFSNLNVVSGFPSPVGSSFSVSIGDLTVSGRFGFDSVANSWKMALHNISDNTDVSEGMSVVMGEDIFSGLNLADKLGLEYVSCYVVGSDSVSNYGLTSEQSVYCFDVSEITGVSSSGIIFVLDKDVSDKFAKSLQTGYNDFDLKYDFDSLDYSESVSPGE